MAARILHLSDTHIGFDTPQRERVVRRRRGPDFLASFERALAPALRGEVDLVVHTGDLFHRSRVSAAVAEQGLAPLRRVAEAGVSVFLLPGNHERSRIPLPLLAMHPKLHVFHEPCTFSGTWGGVRLAIAGFPFARNVAPRAFAEQLAATRDTAHEAEVRLLCLHQSVEGARCGPGDFTFRPGRDVVAAASIPSRFHAVLVGHIHRHQVLTRDLAGRRLAAPVLFCGSAERTSFAELGEQKGTLRLLVARDAPVRWRFDPLPTRPMASVTLRRGPGALERLARELEPLPSDAIVRLELVGEGAVPSAAALRRLAPRINWSVRWPRAPVARTPAVDAVASGSTRARIP